MRALHKVLVVDDDPVVGKSFNRVLSQKGYVVVTAEDAHEALEKMRQEDYDVVFTDIKMPGMDGLELAERVKAKRPWTPVVIVTGYGTKANEERARAAGVSDFLQKPLSPEMIEGSAQKALLQPAPATMAQPVAAPAAEVQVAVLEKESRLKNIALFLAAPFIGLAYALLLPWVGMAMLAVMAARELAKIPVARKTFDVFKTVGKVVAAPFVGLAYVLLFPLVGLAMLAWFGVLSLKAKPSID